MATKTKAPDKIYFLLLDGEDVLDDISESTPYLTMDAAKDGAYDIGMGEGDVSMVVTYKLDSIQEATMETTLKLKTVMERTSKARGKAKK